MSYVYSRPYHESYRKLGAQYETDTQVESNRKSERKKTKYGRKKYKIGPSHMIISQESVLVILFQNWNKKKMQNGTNSWQRPQRFRAAIGTTTYVFSK
jgi:hypothetical protein